MRTYIFILFLFFFCDQVYSQDSSIKVVAKKGDGIFTLLRRHGLDPSEHLHAFLELNKDNIGKDNSLFIGKSYLLPSIAAGSSASQPSKFKSGTSAVTTTATPVGMDVSLFGEKYSRIDVKSQQLKGAVYYLMAGHGGPDPGAIGKYGSYSLAEDEYAYDVTIRLARVLMEHGAIVYMIVQDENDGIRDEHVLKMDRDETTYPDKPVPYSQKERLRQRTRAVNALYAKHKGAYQRMLSVHIDSRSKSQNIDVFFYHHENSPDGQKLAAKIHDTFTSNYNQHQPNRDYFGSVSHRSSLYVIKYSTPPAVFIELGNIRNNKDQIRFVIPDNRQALANWICEGIISDYSTR